MNFIRNRNFRAGPQTSLEGFICPQNSDKQQKIKVFGRSGGGTSPSLKNKKNCWLLILLLVAFRCCFATGAFHILYAFAFIILFVNAPRFKWLDRLLQEMGRRSTSMWFVHSCFCYYLFHDFVYGLKYPLVIFLFLVVVSYLTAVVIDKINSKLSALCFRKF